MSSSSLNLITRNRRNNPGDDNDIVEGQAGFDTMLFNGANIRGFREGL